MIDSQVRLDEAEKAFKKFGRCRIRDFLQVDLAERLYRTLSESTAFDVAYACSPTPKLVSPDFWRNMDPSALNSIKQQLVARAREGQGFLYCTYMARERQGAASENPEVLDEAFAHWSGTEMRELVSRVTGIVVGGAESQFTRFSTGQYLTRHRDALDGNKRLLAFVLSLSKDWHPDWGGLLQFYEESGDVSETWTPSFNTLQLFDISHIHGVSLVTPAAPRGRYSLTGWFTS